MKLRSLWGDRKLFWRNRVRPDRFRTVNHRWSQYELCSINLINNQINPPLRSADKLNGQKARRTRHLESRYSQTDRIKPAFGCLNSFNRYVDLKSFTTKTERCTEKTVLQKKKPTTFTSSFVTYLVRLIQHPKVGRKCQYGEKFYTTSSETPVFCYITPLLWCCVQGRLRRFTGLTPLCAVREGGS